MREIVFTAALAAIAAVIATVAVLVFLLPPKAVAENSSPAAPISPFAMHLELDVRRLPVKHVVDYTNVFPVL